MIVLQPTPNDIHHSFTATRNTDLSNPVIANYTAIEHHPIQTSMYQSASIQAQQSFAYSNAPTITNTHQQYSALHSRSSSESSLSRNSPSDNTFLDSTSYTLSPSSCRYDNSNMSTTNMTAQDSRPQSQGTPVIPTAGENIGQTYTIGNDPRASVTVTTHNLSGNNHSTHSQNTLSVKVLPSLSEVLPSQTLAMQAVAQQTTSSPTASPTQPQLVPNIQVQPQQHSQSSNLHMSMAAPTAQSVSGFYQPIQQYSEVNASYTNAPTDGNYSTQQSIMSQNHQQAVAQQPINQLNQQNIGQTSQLATLVDPRTLPPIVGNTTDLPTNLSIASNSTALVDATGRRLTLNTGGITVNGSETTSLGANASTGSHIMPPGHGTSLNYSPAAFLNGAFVTAAQVNNVLMSSSQRTMSNRSVDRINGRDLDNTNIPANLERPQKVYSFVPLPGINTKKRPRRRYDEIERHYACNWPGCSKSYGTLNHLNAHVQMQKHGPKRNPAEFKEQRKIWRRQKREEEERKAVEAAAAKQSAAVVTTTVVNSGLTSLPGSI